MLGQRENTITRSTGRFCLNQDNNKTKGRSQVRGDGENEIRQRDGGIDRFIKKKERRKNKNVFWQILLVSGCARTRKLWRFDERRTAHTSIPHYLLTTARVRKDIFISSLSFDEKKKNFIFKLVWRAKQKTSFFWLDYSSFSLSPSNVDHFTAVQEEIRQFKIFRFLWCLSIVGSFLSRHFCLRYSVCTYTQSLNICGKS